MMQKILFLILLAGCIFLCKDLSFLKKRNLHVSNALELLTKEEQEKLPSLIATSFKEMFYENIHFTSFIEGLATAEQEKTNNYQESPEIQAYREYTMQIALDPKIVKNLDASVQYLQKKQAIEDIVSLLDDRICYKILKNGNETGIEDNKINKVKLNFIIKDIDNNFLAGNYALSGPISCALSELIPGMAYGMLGMRLHEVREIYVHPELAYGVFSSFGHGKAFSITVELVECIATNAIFSPCLTSVDLTKTLCSNKVNAISLEKDLMFFCGKASWYFYKQKLPQLHLEDVLIALQSGNSVLSVEDRATLYKLQWLIYNLPYAKDPKNQLIRYVD